MKAKQKSESNMQKSWMMSALERISEQNADHPLIIQGNEVQTRAQILEISQKIAGFLVEHGVKRDTRVIFDIDIKLSWRVLACWCACQCVGAVAFFWPVDMRYRHEVEEMKASDAMNDTPTMVLLGSVKRVEQWRKADLENHVSGRVLLDLTGACHDMNDVVSWDKVLQGAIYPPTECPNEATILYTQGSHQFERSVELSLTHLRDEAEELQKRFELDMNSRLLSDLQIVNSVNLSLFAACVHSGAVWVCHDINAGLSDLKEAGITHAFLLPSTLSRYIEQIKFPEDHSAFSLRWRRFGLRACRLRAKRKTIFTNMIQKGIIAPLRETYFPALKAIISYGNHFETEIGEFFSYLDIPVFNAYTLSELGFVHVHAFMGDGGFLKCVDARIKSGILAVKSKRSNHFIDTEDLVFEDERSGLCSKRSFMIKLENGVEVDVSPMREILRREALIDEIFIFGSGKPYLTGLIYLNEKAFRAFAQENKLEGEFADLAQDAQVYKYIRGIVDRCNLRRSSNESIQKIAILRCPLERDPRILTPCGLTRRVDVERRYAQILDAFYRENF